MSLTGNATANKLLRGNVNGLKTINGYSAYEVAVIQGFSGTEEEWLASLRGEPGKTAYDYAKESGYAGTEEEFANKLAQTPEATDTNAYLEGRFDNVEASVEELREQVDTLNDTVYGTSASSNLLPIDYVSGEQAEINGVTYEKREDGTVVATGTPTTTSRYYFMKGNGIKAGTYTLSGLPVEGGTEGRTLKYRVGGEGSNEYFKTGSRTITIEEDTIIDVFIDYGVSHTFTEPEVWRVMLEEGSVAHDFVSPRNAADGIEKTVAKHTDQIAEMQEAVEWLENKPENDLPPYYDNYIAERIAVVNDKDCLVGSHGDGFVFITDTHLERNKMNSPALIKEIIGNTAVRFVINGGDTLDADPTQGEALARFREWRKLMHGVEEYRVKGNHDLNGSGQSVTEAVLTEDQWYGTMVKPIEHLVNTNGKYYYCVDNQSQKIRYVCAAVSAWLHVPCVCSLCTCTASPMPAVWTN